MLRQEFLQVVFWQGAEMLSTDDNNTQQAPQSLKPTVLTAQQNSADGGFIADLHFQLKMYMQINRPHTFFPKSATCSRQQRGVTSFLIFTDSHEADTAQKGRETCVGVCKQTAAYRIGKIQKEM